VVVLGEKGLYSGQSGEFRGRCHWRVVGKSRSVLTLRQGTGAKCVVQDRNTITGDRQEVR